MQQLPGVRAGSLYPLVLVVFLCLTATVILLNQVYSRFYNNYVKIYIFLILLIKYNYVKL